MRVELKYGCNPHQGNAAFESGETPPVRVRNGAPSMINMLDALNGWQLVAELGGVLDLPAAASFKHVSPAGVAVGVPLPEDLRRAYEVGDRELTPLAAAYVRARGADPKCSFGDFVALSEPVDAATAAYLRGVVSDGIIAPGFGRAQGEARTRRHTMTTKDHFKGATPERLARALLWPKHRKPESNGRSRQTPNARDTYLSGLAGESRT